MTGFGAAEGELDGVAVGVEARSVNSRHLKVAVRTPTGLEGWEPGLRELVGEHVRRGHLNLLVRVDERPAAGREEPELELDEERVEASLAALGALKQRFGVSGDVDLATLARFGPLLRPAAHATDPPPLDGVKRLAATALEALVRMRQEEGERLEADLRARLAAIEERLGEVGSLAPERLERERERLRDAVRELTRDVSADEDRLAREIALIADRWDIGEELVRARSHLTAFDELLDAPGEEPVGKRFTFLAQELLRELNTIGAKANDASISRHVVEMKNELETLREQVENIE